MKLYREENIQKIIGAIELDEYDDSTQDKNVGQEDFELVVDKFLDLNVLPGQVLEIGCGSGDSLGKYGITHGIEPCEKRFNRAKEKGFDVRRNVAEYIEFEDHKFDTVLMINGFFQVRSDYEALIEINRVLKIGGRFIINLLINDDIDIILGRCLGYKNYIRLMNQFGFELVAYNKHNAGKRFTPAEQIGVVIAMEKVRDFDNRYLNLPQVTDFNAFKNFIKERDWKLF